MSDVTAKVTAEMVAPMFPATPVANIRANLLFVLAALREAGIGDADMICMALATIRAETASFEPIAEGESRFNTAPFPGGAPFCLYDFRTDLGNHGPGTGAKYRGRGYVQLTGQANYATYGAKIGVDLVAMPDAACSPPVAARLLARFLADHQLLIRRALADDDQDRGLADARRSVNGGTNGLEAFTDAFLTGQDAIPVA